MFRSRHVHILDILVDFALNAASDKTRKMFQELLLVTSTRYFRMWCSLMAPVFVGAHNCKFVGVVFVILFSFPVALAHCLVTEQFYKFRRIIKMQGLRLDTSEIDRLRGADLKNLLRERKLVLILDLDHTLINSTKLKNISSAEKDLGIQTAAS
jgi:hypothetical protein